MKLSGQIGKYFQEMIEDFLGKTQILLGFLVNTQSVILNLVLNKVKEQ
jgi:hypothetical protein